MRRWVGVLLGLVALAAGIGALWTYLSDGASEMTLVLVDVDGTVTLAGPDGTALAAEVGRPLDASDHVATGKGSRAVLGLGSETRIRLGPESSLAVTSVGADGVRLELEGGALEATVRPGSGAVRVGNAGREVVATNAEFAVGVSDGVLQVEARDGELGLSGVDETRLQAGNVATLVDRKAAIAAIPEELLLEVRWPSEERTRAATQEVAGRTVPGALVAVRGGWGEPVVGRADAEGRFRIEVPLTEGRNPVTVHATDPLGNRADVEGVLNTRDTLGPRSKSGVIYGD